MTKPSSEGAKRCSALAVWSTVFVSWYQAIAAAMAGASVKYLTAHLTAWVLRLEIRPR